MRFDTVFLLEATISYEREELEAQIYGIFHPEPVIGNEGPEFYEMPPLPRLKDEYGIDASYWKPDEYGSISRLMRRAAVKDDEKLAEVVKAQQVPREQFFGTLRLFGDAILAYQGQHERSGPYRFYPAILVSAWASFEAYVRIYSELFVQTAKNLPVTISDALLEIDSFLDAQGRIPKRAKFQALLGRYWWLLKFGYSCDFDRGSRIWQLGEAALRARNELVHYEIQGMPSLKTIELWAHLEAILLLFIGPSAQIGRSVVPDIYELYGVLCELRPLLEEYEERPHFKYSRMNLGGVMFPCPFDGVDEDAFPHFGPKDRA
jgi:hypothetical protein